jgi:hypothetical protein
VTAAARDRGARRCHYRAWQLTGASLSVVYGRWSRARGAQNEEETKGILTKGFVMERRPHGELTTATLLLHGSPQLGGFSSGRFTPGSAQAASPCSRGALQGPNGVGKQCAAAAALELELNSCDGEKLLWGQLAAPICRPRIPA